MREWPEFLPQDLEPRDWVVQLGGLVTHFLFCSIHLQSIAQRFTEVTGDERVWVLSGT